MATSLLLLLETTTNTLRKAHEKYDQISRLIGAACPLCRHHLFFLLLRIILILNFKRINIKKIVNNTIKVPYFFKTCGFLIFNNF